MKWYPISVCKIYLPPRPDSASFTLNQGDRVRFTIFTFVFFSSIIGLSATAKVDEIKDAKFVLDKSIPSLGHAMKDVSGVIWGNVFVHPKGSFEGQPWITTYDEAVDACKKIGARLPTYADVLRLRDYSGPSYNKQVLPRLFHEPDQTSTGNVMWGFNEFWIYDDGFFDNGLGEQGPLVFNGKYGTVSVLTESNPLASVRCVVDSTPLKNNPEIRFSKKQDGSLVQWKRDRVNHLGDAWKVDGLVWGGKATRPKWMDSSSSKSNDEFTFQEALKYCAWLDARLPTVEEVRRLREYLGEKLRPLSESQYINNYVKSASGEFVVDGYIPQVLPDLVEEKNGKVVENVFRIQPYAPHEHGLNIEFFFGKSGKIEHIPTSNENWVKTQVRCVVDTNTKKAKRRPYSRNDSVASPKSGPYLINVRGNRVPIQDSATGPYRGE